MESRGSGRYRRRTETVICFRRPIRVYMKADETRLVDKMTEGTQGLTIPVSRSMKIIEVGLENLQKNQNITVVNLTCTLKFWS